MVLFSHLTVQLPSVTGFHTQLLVAWNPAPTFCMRTHVTGEEIKGWFSQIPFSKCLTYRYICKASAAWSRPPASARWPCSSTRSPGPCCSERPWGWRRSIPWPRPIRLCGRIRAEKRKCVFLSYWLSKIIDISSTMYSHKFADLILRVVRHRSCCSTSMEAISWLANDRESQLTTIAAGRREL